jgi:hypothetical protein
VVAGVGETTPAPRAARTLNQRAPIADGARGRALQHRERVESLRLDSRRGSQPSREAAEHDAAADDRVLRGACVIWGFWAAQPA